jgi:hypothetical protein
MVHSIDRELTKGDHTLIEGKLIEYNNNDGFFNTESWKLSDTAKKDLLPELRPSKNSKKNLFLFDAIKPKKMFYNDRETEAIQTLSSLLSEENYRKI